MADWFYIGYCTVMAMFAVAAAYVAAFGLRALCRLPRSLLLGFAAAAIVATLAAQKTNNVPPNMNSPLSQMQQGGGFSQTGFTGLAGLSGALPHMPSSLNPVNLVNPVQNNIPVQITNADISRGWRVESVTTNAAVSYVMPTNAVTVGNWHIHGAVSSFGNNRIDFGDWVFPLGTNDEAFSAFWYFIDGRIRPTPRDAAHEICAVGVPMSAVPRQSRLWRLDGDNGSRVLTWENFFLGGDTNSPLNAQIVLSPNGDFLTRSNEVETVCRRVNPDDWDDDGIPNDEDANPTVYDGDFFGPANILPAGANTNAYCTISVVATGPDALVTFAGDKPCNYPDPRFVAKSGVTNEVVILIGKTYAISSDWPFAVVGVSDPDTEVWQMRGAAHQTYVCRPVTISASDGNPFTMSVVPLNLGGVFLWPSAQCGCAINGSGDTFTWNCPTSCTCCGCDIEGQYSYEGYWLPATSCLCGCYYNGEGPTWTDDNEDPDNSGPFAASVSAAFSKSAVIFENAYENMPGQWGEKRSTRTRLNIVAHGGPNGAALSVANTNFGKLSHISGPGLPLAAVAIPANTSVSYAIVYEGAQASDAADDISVTATLTENVTGSIYTNSCAATSVRLEMSPVWAAPENPCTNRHIYGVGERVRIRTFPESVATSVQLTRVDMNEVWHYDNIINSAEKIYACPIYSATPNLKVVCSDAEYRPVMSILEPASIICKGAAWDTPCLSPGVVGGTMLATTNYVGPMSVSFRGVLLSEVPCVHTNTPTGYFATNYTGQLTHWYVDFLGGAMAFRVKNGNYWTVDRAGHPGAYEDWSAGRLEWDIPIGWFRMLDEDDMMHVIGDYEYQIRRDTTTRPFLVGGRIDAYKQIFTISEDGTASVEKHGHILSRRKNCHVLLDGKTIQWTHWL